MESSSKKVPLVVIRRLPRYYRYLTEFLDNGIVRISSKALSEKMNVTASQIRQDLNCFGGFGQQGYGYNVEQLHNAIGDILGLNKKYKMIIIGAGNLGRTLANYAGFEKRGFRVIAVFDNDKSLEGKEIKNIKILHTDKLEEFCKKNKPDIAVLAIPKASVVEMAEMLDEYGVKGLWNFSYTDIQTKNNIPIESVHLSDSLMTLSYQIGK